MTFNESSFSCLIKWFFLIEKQFYLISACYNLLLMEFASELILLSPIPLVDKENALKTSTASLSSF